MGNKELVKTTDNRGEFNRIYKRFLDHEKDGINCSFCGYHRGENKTTKDYGGYVRSNGLIEIKYPNWKLVSKNPKQWMKKPMKIKTEYRINHSCEYIEIIF